MWDSLGKKGGDTDAWGDDRDVLRSRRCGKTPFLD
jgi:hypothetical protein